MLSFYGTLAGVTANLLKDEAKVTITCRAEDMDADVLDGLAGLSNTQAPSDVSLSGEGREVALPCTVAGVVTDHAKRLVKIVLAMPEKRIEAADKSTLELWFRMENEIAVEVSSRQMSFKDITPRASRKVTVKIGGQEFDLETVKAGLGVLEQRKALKVNPESGEVLE